MTIRTLAAEVVNELKVLGISAAVLPEREINQGATDIQLDGFKISARPVPYGANVGRIDWIGYADTLKGTGHYDRPLLGKTQSANDAPAKRIAKALASKIIEPAEQPIQDYRAIGARVHAQQTALPVAMQNLRERGFSVQEPREETATSASFYYSHLGAQMSGDVRADGSVSLRSGFFNAEQMSAIMVALRDLEKSNQLMADLNDAA
jgi:hypothetical protein